jgi:hypothetical protein
MLFSVLIVLGARKLQARQTQSNIKYCSNRCRSQRPGSKDAMIEKIIAALLDGRPEAVGLDATSLSKPVKRIKGDQRVILSCEDIEAAVFGSRHDPEKTFGRKKNRASRAIEAADGGDSVNAEDTTNGGVISPTASCHSSAEETVSKGARVRPPQTESDVNGSVGGEKGWAERKEETEEAMEKRQEGLKRAEQREMVRRAARRAVIFGLEKLSVEGDKELGSTGKSTSRQRGATEEKHPNLQKCEALMHGQLVEPSFAKGNWSIRWRTE